MNNEKIALLVDSCTDISADLAKKYNIYVIPLKIIYKNAEYTDGVDITADDIYNKLSIETPSTSLPSGGDITKIFEQIASDGYEKVLAVTISDGLSGTYNSINFIGQQHPTLEVFVVNTKNIGIGSGFVAIQASGYISEGMKWNELKEKVSTNISKSKVFFCVSTLEYLVKGGRIGLVASLAGNLLNLKPIISCNENGIYYTVAKVRGRKQSLLKLIDIVSNFAETGKKYNVGLVHCNAKEDADNIKELLMSKLPYCNIYVEGQVTPALGVHTGPGLIGIGIQLIDD
ncbi:MAG: DegV family protein [Clostridium sp.]|uniref:DegV family protein n=1 Tax=Clostridium sp. TaxID=1506 RepID=UPI003067D9D5